LTTNLPTHPPHPLNSSPLSLMLIMLEFRFCDESRESYNKYSRYGCGLFIHRPTPPTNANSRTRPTAYLTTVAIPPCHIRPLLLLQLPANLTLITAFPTCTYRDRAIARPHTLTSGRGMELARGGAGVPHPGVVLGVCVGTTTTLRSAPTTTLHSPKEYEGLRRHPYTL